MDFLQSYNSDETFSEDCGSFQEALGEKEVRSIYLTTYSQANLDLFPTRRICLHGSKIICEMQCDHYTVVLQL